MASVLNIKDSAGNWIAVPGLQGPPGPQGAPGPGIPSGGTTGQVLKKSSDSDLAVEWGDAADPNAISGDGSIKKIVEITYKEYLDLEAAGQLETSTEYHISDMNISDGSYIAGNIRVHTTDTELESNIGASHPTSGEIYVYANKDHHGLYSNKWSVLIDASNDGIIFNGIADRATADGNGNDIAATYQPKIYDSGWIYPTLQNGWTAYDENRPFKYRKIGDVVYLQGSIKGGTNKAVVCTLPAGFRPGVPYSNCPIRINASEIGWFFVNYSNSLNGVVAIETSNASGASEFIECPMFNISYIAEA